MLHVPFNRKKQWLVYDGLPGQCNFQNLYEEMAELAPEEGGTFVEVGAGLGKSTAFMAIAIDCAKKKTNFYTVDTWDGKGIDADIINEKGLTPGTVYPAFWQNIRSCRIGHIVKTLCASQQKAAKQFDDNSLDFVFLHNIYDYQTVRDGVATWKRKVRRSTPDCQGGVLAGFNYPTLHAVEQAVHKLLPNAVHYPPSCFTVHC